MLEGDSKPLFVTEQPAAGWLPRAQAAPRGGR
jgi:hypothetical protein